MGHVLIKKKKKERRRLVEWGCEELVGLYGTMISGGEIAEKTCHQLI